MSREVGREAEIMRRIIIEDLRRMRKEFPELFHELLRMGSPLALEVLEKGGEEDAEEER